MAVAFVSFAGRDRHWSEMVANELTALGYEPSLHELGGAHSFDELSAWLAAPHRPDDLLLCVISADYPIFSISELLTVDTRPRLVLFAFVAPVILPPQAHSFERCDLFALSDEAARSRLRAFLADRRTPLHETAAVRPALPIAALMRKRAAVGSRPARSAERKPYPDGPASDVASRPSPAPAPMPPSVGASAGYASIADSTRAGAFGKWPWLLAGAGAAVAGYLARHQIADAARGFMSLLGLATTPVPPSPAPKAAAMRDLVDASAFAPSTARAGEDFLVQIFLHAPGDAATAAMLAREADADAGRRGVATLEVEVARGQRIDIALEAEGLAIDEPIQSLTWRGEPRACQFTLTPPSDAVGRPHQIKASVRLGGIPLGTLRFVVKVAVAATAPLDITGEAARRYTHAFLSHSHDDRVKVLTYAQLLEAAGIKYFQDIASLRVMENWEARLHQAIDQCDLFLLFWTASAAHSDWVERETRHAMQRQGASIEGMPDITPVFLDPDPPHPPDWLRSRHFDSILRLAMRGAAADAERKRTS